jgi:hypothetical protein
VTAPTPKGKPRDVKKLCAFAKEVLNAGFEGNLDGCEIQEIGVKHGLLREVKATEPCTIGCLCEEMGVDFPTTCYRFTPLLQRGLRR